MTAGTEPRRYGDPLPPAQLTRLREQVACLGCGAVREDRPNATRTQPGTHIQHRRRCPTRALEQAEQKEQRRIRRLAVSASRRRRTDQGGGAA